MSFLIISGLSGSGKSIALQALEDMSFYCIDNLPAAMVPHLAREITSAKSETLKNVAIGLDARNLAFLHEVPKSLEELQSLGIQYRIVFLEAEESVLVKRFKQTRRKHPLIDKQTSLLEGIRREKTLLEPISFAAAIRIDTTHTTPAELRQQLHDFAVGQDTAGVTLLFESFGFKHGTPMDADYVFDIRCLPNPYWEAELRKYSGLEEPVVKFLEQHEQVHHMFQDICTFLERWLPSFEREQRSYMTIAVGCTGGQHRSVYMVRRLAEHFARNNVTTQIRHRELT
ncbi:MAG: RNase adapter RapZ [Acidiferrobacterales bacterium]